MRTLIAINNMGSSDRTPEIVYRNFSKLLTDDKYNSDRVHTLIFTDKDWSNFKCKSAKIPPSVYNIPKINNIILNYARANGYTFVHLLHDDLIISDTFNYENYEKLMTDFDIGFYTYPKLNRSNYVYDVIAPRFRIATKKYYSHPVDFYTVESNEYNIIDLSKNNLIYDTRFEYMYSMAFIFNCKCHKHIPFLNFYIDCDFGNDIVRSQQFPPKTKDPEKFKKENSLADSLNIKWVVDSNLDEVMNFFLKKRGF